MRAYRFKTIFPTLICAALTLSSVAFATTDYYHSDLCEGSEYKLNAQTTADLFALVQDAVIQGFTPEAFTTLNRGLYLKAGLDGSFLNQEVIARHLDTLTPEDVLQLLKSGWSLNYCQKP